MAAFWKASTMSAHALGVLGSGPEPPPLRMEPTECFVMMLHSSSCHAARRSNCSSWPIFSCTESPAMSSFRSTSMRPLLGALLGRGGAPPGAERGCSSGSTRRASFAVRSRSSASSARGAWSKAREQRKTPRREASKPNLEMMRVWMGRQSSVRSRSFSALVVVPNHCACSLCWNSLSEKASNSSSCSCHACSRVNSGSSLGSPGSAPCATDSENLPRDGMPEPSREAPAEAGGARTRP
mmetsp:Transcript_94884/g.277422  ORF Transcript_94884/g.277422 Transcript_94884/m.277422 type:complete len:239 (+) Transcript_94884:44-760(+)